MMFTSRLVVALTALGLVAAACGDSSDGPDAESDDVVSSDLSRAGIDPASAHPVSDATLRFGLDLYRELTAAEDSNLVFSPHSVAVALAMTRAGAEGATAAAMDATMHSPGAGLHPGFNALDQMLAGRSGEQERSDGSTAVLELNIANALWGQAGLSFLDPFLDTLAESYGAGVRVVDYAADAEAARLEINQWVSDQTSNRITDLVPAGALNSLTRLVLTNAVYLLAPWELPFEPEATEPGPFVRLDGTEVDVELMRQAESIGYARIGDVQAVELPYAGREMAMLVLVPDDGSFSNVEEALSPQFVAEAVEALEVRPVELRFPRFEFRTQASLAQVLRSLGMAVAFDPDRADFSAMTADEQLFIADVIHEAFISVDEEGTEAAAATAVAMATTSAPAEPVDVVIDRPFLFLLRDTETGALLFLGRVTDPSR